MYRRDQNWQTHVATSRCSSRGHLLEIVGRVLLRRHGVKMSVRSLVAKGKKPEGGHERRGQVIKRIQMEKCFASRIVQKVARVRVDVEVVRMKMWELKGMDGGGEAGN